jgi:hypothetical protein
LAGLKARGYVIDLESSRRSLRGRRLPVQLSLMSRSRASAVALAAMVCLLAGTAGLRGAVAVPTTESTTPDIVLNDPDGRPVAPFRAAEQSAAIVFLFASVDCPVSNRYAPEVQRLHAAFAPRNVAFWMVYPNPSDTPDAVREHLKAFNYPVHALLDPRHELVKLAEATITPEAAVFGRRRALEYHGRIDDRFVSLGVERPAATRHDLFDALTAVVDGHAPAVASAPAVGCFIADFVQ